MKIATIIGICALVGATALGCSGSGSSGGSNLGNSESGSDTSSGSSSSTGSSSGTSSSGTSGSGSSASGSSSGTSSAGSSSGSGTPSDAGGGVVTSDAAPMDDPETDYTQTKTITMDSFSVPAGAEVYYCQTFANPWGAQVDIKTYSLDMSEGSHHMFAFYDQGATTGAAAMCSGLSFGAFTFTAQSHQLTQTYPTTVGATIPAGTGFNMMVHYLNTGSTTIQSHVALTMYVAKPNVVTQHAGVIFLNNAGIYITPQISTATSSYQLSQAVSIMWTDSHMHQGADSFVATTSGPAGNGMLFTTDQWAEPPAQQFSPPLQLPSGTTITWTCTYPNATTTRTFGESAQTNVMCISTSIFYPVSDVNNPVLGSPISGLL
jgi:hypothetical protein